MYFCVEEVISDFTHQRFGDLSSSLLSLFYKI